MDEKSIEKFDGLYFVINQNSLLIVIRAFGINFERVEFVNVQWFLLFDKSPKTIQKEIEKKKEYLRKQYSAFYETLER